MLLQEKALLLSGVALFFYAGELWRLYDRLILNHQGAGLFGASAYFSVWALHMLLAGSRGKRLNYIILGAAAEIVRVLMLSPHYGGSKMLWTSAGVCAGVAAILYTALEACFEKDRQKALRMWALSAWTAIFAMLAYHSLYLTYLASRSAVIFDAQLYRIDLAFGFNLPVFAGQVFGEHRTFAIIAGKIYYTLPIMIAAAYFLVWLKNRPQHTGVLRVFTLSLLGCAGYLLVPAIGLHYAFEGQFPYAMPLAGEPVTPVRNGAGYVANAMPSMHFVWALLCLYCTAGMHWVIRGVMALLLALTLTAMFGTGNHYAVDMVVAYPLAVAAWAAGWDYTSCRWQRRAGVIGCMASLALSWLLLIRHRAEMLYDDPALLYLFTALTFAAGWLGKRLVDKPAAAV